MVKGSVDAFCTKLAAPSFDRNVGTIRFSDLLEKKKIKAHSMPRRSFSNPVALPDLYFYWSLHPVAAIVLSGGFIVSILLPIVSFSNHRPRLEWCDPSLCLNLHYKTKDTKRWQKNINSIQASVLWLEKFLSASVS